MSKKTMTNRNVTEAAEADPDLQVTGNGDAWQLLCKAASANQGWMKSTKAMEIANYGCLVQVTTQNGDAIAEAVTFVPHTKIVEDVNGGRKLARV